MEEKIEFKNNNGLKLVGVLQTANASIKKVVILAHGFTSNKNRDRFKLVSKEFAKNGIAFFRFDFGGLGESENEEITLSGEQKDLEAAITLMKKKGFKDIGLVGESLGGMVVLQTYTTEIMSVCLWSSQVKARTMNFFEDKENQKMLTKLGKIVKEKDGRNYRVSNKLNEEISEYPQKELLSKVVCPVLLIKGGDDDSVPLSDSKETLSWLPMGSKLEVVEGADHKFNGHAQDAANLMVDWFKKNLSE